MIPDWRKNKLYLSKKLKTQFPKGFSVISNALRKYNVSFDVINDTKDIWARDYMPVQVGEKEFIQFRYEPDYLDGYDEIRTIPSEIEMLKDVSIIKSNLNIDGGNVVCSKSKVILTDRVFQENPSLSKEDIKKELEQLFQSQVYFVPAIKSDMTGHIDGHLRFINNDTIIVNKLDQEYSYWQIGFLKMIKESGLKYIEMPWYEDKNDALRKSAIGSYLNYLQLDKLILFPVFKENTEMDKKALEIVKKIYPKIDVEPIEINSFGKEGGLMNCITWTIYD